MRREHVFEGLEFGSPRIPEAPKTDLGFWQVRPGDIVHRSDLMLIDVRSRVEDAHIHGVQHGWPLIEAPALDTPLVFICGDGFSSVRCARTAVRQGYLEVYHLVGGMKRWLAEGRPVARRPSWHRALVQRLSRHS